MYTHIYIHIYICIYIYVYIYIIFFLFLSETKEITCLFHGPFLYSCDQLSSVTLVFDSLQYHGPQHASPPCQSPTPGVYPNSYPLSP